MKYITHRQLVLTWLANCCARTDLIKHAMHLIYTIMYFVDARLKRTHDPSLCFLNCLYIYDIAPQKKTKNKNRSLIRQCCISWLELEARPIRSRLPLYIAVHLELSRCSYTPDNTHSRALSWAVKESLFASGVAYILTNRYTFLASLRIPERRKSR